MRVSLLGFRTHYHLKKLVLLILFGGLVACGGGDGNGLTEQQEDNDNTRMIYLSVVAVTEEGQYSGVSNEASTSMSDTDTLQIDLLEPVLQMDGECLTSPIERFIVFYGGESSSYDNRIEFTKTSTSVSCNATDVHAVCGDIFTCTIDVVL